MAMKGNFLKVSSVCWMDLFLCEELVVMMVSFVLYELKEALMQSGLCIPVRAI